MLWLCWKQVFAGFTLANLSDKISRSDKELSILKKEES